MPRRWSRSANAFSRLAGVGRQSVPGIGLKGIRFTKALNSEIRLASWSASSKESFTPSIMTYSKVIRFPPA
mgnify:CR=1 FL=1